ncbi:MAG: glycosyltransferase family 2 protein, partial [Thermoplasmata archaeon]|nr:glycosyltransferase family 2 protein [Thermoplasmata archaeon]
FMALLFATLAFPGPITVTRRWPRAPNTFVLFFGSLGLSLILAIVALYFLYHSAGLGRNLVPFAILLLIPVTALTIWGGVGRILYDRELFLRPVPDVATYHPRVSVIIPAYNEGHGIAAAIRSADTAAGLYPGDAEIIVANDGSHDDTVARAREAIGSLRHATGAVLDLPHGGKSNALNGALSASTGEIIIRVDADARISTTLGFGALVPHFADPEVGGVQGLILPLQQEGWTRKLRFLEIAWNHLYLRRAMMATRSTQVVDGAFCAFRRADLERLGGWVSWNGEDTEITLRFQRMGYRTRFETAAAAFEDVPSNYSGLRKQRIRWNRGGLFAHRRHLPGLFSDAPEFGSLAILLWFSFFVRGGLRTLIWVYALMLTILLGLPTLLDVALIAAILLVPRGIAIGYYLVKYGRWQMLPYIAMWPIAGSIKQYFALESYGSMLPGSSPEFAE